MRKFVASLASLIILATQGHAEDRPLLKLLDSVPVTASGQLMMFDAAAIRSEIAPFIGHLSETEKPLVQFNLVMPPNGFSTQNIYGLKDDGTTNLGFNFFDLDQVAGWGDLPEAPVIATGRFNTKRINAALRARGFATRDIADTTVWHKTDDYGYDLEQRNLDPFSSVIGSAARFAVRDKLLHYARGFPAMTEMLTHTTSLTTNPNYRSVIEAGYSIQNQGTFISAYFPNQRPVRRVDVSILLKNAMENAGRKLPDLSDMPHLPPFIDYAILQWQDQDRLTAAIAIPYVRRDTAELAIKTFETLLPKLHSPATKKLFDEVLPKTRNFEIVEVDDRYVVLFSFEKTVTPDPENGVRIFVLSPHSRLVHMIFSRDLDTLIGGAL